MHSHAVAIGGFTVMFRQRRHGGRRKQTIQQVAKIVETLHLLGALLISLLSLTLQPPSPPYQCC